MNIFLFSFFAVNHYGTISFSLTPALLATAGLLSLLYSYMEGPKVLLITGIVLTLFASLYRFEGSLFSMIIFLLYSFNRDNIKEKLLSKKVLINIVCIITVIILGITIPINYSVNYRLLYKSAMINHKEDRAEMVDYITSHTNDKFVCKKESFIRKTDNSLNSLFIYVPDKYENTISFDSGCNYYSPNNLRKIHEFGADNLYSYLIDNGGVYLVDYKDVDFASNLLEHLN